MSFMQSIKNFFSEKESCFGVVQKIDFSDKIDYEVTLITDTGEEEVFLIEDRHQTIKEGMKLYIEFFLNPDYEVQTHIVKWKVCDKKTKAGFFLKFIGSSLLILISWKILKVSFSLLSLLLYVLVSSGASSSKGILSLCLFIALTALMFFITVEQVKSTFNAFNKFTESLKKKSHYQIVPDEKFTPPYNRKRIAKYAGLFLCLALFASLFFTGKPESKGQPVSMKQETELVKPQTI